MKNYGKILLYWKDVLAIKKSLFDYYTHLTLAVKITINGKNIEVLICASGNNFLFTINISRLLILFSSWKTFFLLVCLFLVHFLNVIYIFHDSEKILFVVSIFYLIQSSKDNFPKN